jgi:hypothetical protein
MPNSAQPVLLAQTGTVPEKRRGMSKFASRWTMPTHVFVEIFFRKHSQVSGRAQAVRA